MAIHNYGTSRHSKAGKFIELANKRVNRTIKDLRLIGNLSNRSSYEYTREQSERIISSLKREVENVEARFNNERSKSADPFQL